MTHPAVRDAAVVGIPDEVLGQRVAAAVALNGKATHAVLTEILDCTRKQLAEYKVPERLTAVREIPRNTLGKVDRKSLAGMLPETGTEKLAVPL
jgi:long-chain acyl-CoA synthetase